MTLEDLRTGKSVCGGVFIFFVGMPTGRLGAQTPLCAYGEHELDLVGYFKKEKKTWMWETSVTGDLGSWVDRIKIYYIHV